MGRLQDLKIIHLYIIWNELENMDIEIVSFEMAWRFDVDFCDS